MSADINMPEFVDLEDDKLRTLQHTHTAATGHPRISFLAPGQTSTNIVAPTDAGTALAVNVRFRRVSKSTPETPLTNAPMEGIRISHGTSNFGGRSTSVQVNKTTQGERLDIYYTTSAQPGWWGTADMDAYIVVSYGLQVGIHSLNLSQERVKFYYYSGVVPSGTNATEVDAMSGRDIAQPYNHVRKLTFSTAAQPNPSTMYPMLTRPNVATRLTSSQMANTTTNGTYSYAMIGDRSLDVRGTILTLGFKNLTGEDITLLDIEAKNDGLAYNGYFSLGAQAQVGAADRDGIAPAGVMSAAELKAGTPLKFVETSDVGFSQYTLDNIQATGERDIPTYYSFGLYGSHTATNKGVALTNNATTSNATLGRVFLWGYPKNNGNTAVTVRVKYRNASGQELYSKPQVIAPPSGGFQEMKAYLKTIRVVRAS